jgi:N-acetylglucosamine kinase-like BadF-type ATPase
MILIADSGTTKTDWRVIDSEGKISQAICGGINPYYHDEPTISLEVESIVSQINSEVEEIYFYGAGCSSEQNKEKVKNAISQVFPKSKIIVNHDLMAAAHSLCGEESGIACILGTGANSCLYDGESILDNIPALGYIMGDEGSGAYLGKRLLSDYLRRNMPEKIEQLIDKRFGLTKENVLDSIYLQEGASKYLASFSKFIFQNIKQPYLYKLVYTSFEEFFDRNILKYKDYGNHQVHFTGSVAFYYSDILRQVANDKGVSVRNIIESPIAGLTLYHQKQS